MKRIMLIGFMLAVAQFGLAQERVVVTDPTYAEGNYKQPHKAAFAKANNLDRRTVLTFVNVSDQGNYKQPVKKTKMRRSAGFSTDSKTMLRTSYKHPNGL